MDFKDEEIEHLHLANVDDVAQLIIKYLCGKTYPQPISESNKKLIKNLMQKAKTKGLNYEQFNEVLLLLNQDRVGKSFFKFFFGENIVKVDDIRKGVTKFRGLAMLHFGNFRFAYKQLINKNEEELLPYWKKPGKVIDEFKGRPLQVLQIKKIKREKTWYTGEITPAKIFKDADELHKKLSEEKNLKKRKEYLEFERQIIKMDEDAKKNQQKAFGNTDVYLTWEHMDVYIATSMRQKWEYEETFDFIKNIFSDVHLEGLQLRYFNPTMSKCTNPRDKGLIEGLMLKRVLCTIYMAQESDTMGKDSELAATLAQSTPVIAFVPKYEPGEYAKKIAGYPLEFFKMRLLILDAEGTFDDPECERRLRNFDKDFKSIKDTFLKKIYEYRKSWPFSLWTKKDKEFKKKHKESFSKICQILSIAECYNFDRRADLLKGRHPLSMQVDLQTGIANGVLVVRDVSHCIDLLYRLLTNSVEFEIKHPKIFELSEEEARILNTLSNVFRKKFKFDHEMQTLNLLRTLTDQEIEKINELAKYKGCPARLKEILANFQSEGATILKEKISSSTYRVITDNEKLTNSFWNLFA